MEKKRDAKNMEIIQILGAGPMENKCLFIKMQTRKMRPTGSI
jgi:hypothetical protein